jgi:hypothetical protein
MGDTMNIKWTVVGLIILAFTVAGCGATSNHTSTASNGSERYGPACKHELVSAACLEEEEAKKKPIEERDHKEQQKALNQMHEEEAKEGAEQEKESEENSPH